MHLHVQDSAEHTYLSSLAYMNTPQSSHCYVLGQTTDENSTLIEFYIREGKNVMQALQHEQLESHIRNLRHGSANGAYNTGLKLMTHSQGVFFFF